jgi:hypothetical protein
MLIVIVIAELTYSSQNSISMKAGFAKESCTPSGKGASPSSPAMLSPSSPFDMTTDRARTLCIKEFGQSVWQEFGRIMDNR